MPDEAFTRDDATGAARVVVENIPVVDSFQILSPTEEPATASFDITWTAFGAPRHLRPASSDPLDPTAFAGEFKDALAEGTFSGETVTAFGSGIPFSFSGFASSAFAWAEMGTEQNGSFLHGRRRRGNATP